MISNSTYGDGIFDFNINPMLPDGLTTAFGLAYNGPTNSVSPSYFQIQLKSSTTTNPAFDIIIGAVENADPIILTVELSDSDMESLGIATFDNSVLKYRIIRNGTHFSLLVGQIDGTNMAEYFNSQNFTNEDDGSNDVEDALAMVAMEVNVHMAVWFD
jgi:hypothetical protein